MSYDVQGVTKRRCDKTLKTSVVEAEKRTNCGALIRRFANFHLARLFWNLIMQVYKRGRDLCHNLFLILLSLGSHLHQNT